MEERTPLVSLIHENKKSNINKRKISCVYKKNIENNTSIIFLRDASMERSFTIVLVNIRINVQLFFCRAPCLA